MPQIYIPGLMYGVPPVPVMCINERGPVTGASGPHEGTMKKSLCDRAFPRGTRGRTNAPNTRIAETVEA